MTDWRVLVRQSARQCGSCRRASLGGWANGRDGLPLPILRCRELRGLAFPNHEPCHRYQPSTKP